MILIWGFKGYARMLGVMTFVCGHCHNPAAQRVTEYIRKFTFFWIPLFTTKKQVVITCAFCGADTIVPKDHVDQLMADLVTAQAQHQAPAAEQLPQHQEPQG